MRETTLSPIIDGIQIPGLLTMPDHPTAALLLIPGSLNSDIDGNFASMFPGQPSIAPHAYKDLAAQLAALNIAVMRFAKTGPGTGSVVVDKEASAAYKNFAQRVRVAGIFLAELLARLPGLPVVAAGHSEGSVVATLLARNHTEIRGLILLSGPAQPLLHLMARQQFESDRRHGRLTPERERQYAAAVVLLDDFAASRPLAADFAANPYLGMLAFAARPENTPYLRSLELVDPAAEFAQVAQPALIIQGGRDESVAPDNADFLHCAKPAAEVSRFPELQHFYKRVPEGIAPQESFAYSSESDPAVANAIANWIAGLAPTR